jgi:hypothetical protein
MADTQLANLPVQVTVTQGSRTIASQTVRGSHVYVFTLPPGSYVVSSDALGGNHPSRITLHSGEVRQVNLYSMCV